MLSGVPGARLEPARCWLARLGGSDSGRTARCGGRARRLALFSTAEPRSARLGAAFRPGLLARACPVHTKVQFLEQPWLAERHAGSRELPLCFERT